MTTISKTGAQFKPDPSERPPAFGRIADAAPNRRDAAGYARCYPVLLIGLPGAGKSTVGSLLADRLNAPFTDVDREIEKAEGRSIAQIFRDQGEQRFRVLEKWLISDLLTRGQGIIAAGGGAYVNADTRALAAIHGCAVWLRGAPEKLWTRLQGGSDRPLLNGENAKADFMTMAETRTPLYQLSQITVDCDDAAPEQVVERIVAALQEFLETRQ